MFRSAYQEEIFLRVSGTIDKKKNKNQNRTLSTGKTSGSVLNRVMKTPPGVRRRVPSAIIIPPDASIPRVASNNSKAFSSPISSITL